MRIPFFGYSAIDQSLLAGLAAGAAWLFFRRLDSAGAITDLIAQHPTLHEDGGGQYSFELDESLFEPNSSISYVIDLGATAYPRIEENHVFADKLGDVIGVNAANYVNEGIDQRFEVLVDTADSLVYWPRVDGLRVTPTSGTFTVESPSASVLAGPTAFVVGANGQLPISQAWPEARYPIGEDYQTLVTYVVAGVTYSDRIYFDVVRTKLLCLIDDDMLQGVYPDIENHLLGIGETNTAKFIRRGWSQLLDRIRAGGNRPSLILDKQRLINPGIERALQLACFALSKDPADLWDMRAQAHEKRYEEFMKGLGQLRYDLNEDAQADRSEETRVVRRRFSV